MPKVKPNRLIYLASPYSDESVHLERLRYIEAANVAGKLIMSGHAVISPIAHGHAIAECSGVGRSAAAWLKVNEQLVAAADELWVLMLPGWRDSLGVRQEMQMAKAFGNQVRFLTQGLQLRQNA